MKRLMKKLAGVILAAAIAIGCIPAMSAEAATITPSQSAATKTSVTLTWPAVSGATQYTVTYLVYKANEEYASATSDLTTDTTYTVSGLPTNGYVYSVVRAYDSSNAKLAESDVIIASTLPTKVTKLKYNTYFNQADPKLAVAFTASNAVKYCADGFLAEAYNYKGTKIQTLSLGSNYQVAEFSKTNITNAYKVKITPFIKIGTKKVRGTKSAWFYAVPSPKLIKKNSYVKASSMKVRFVPVKGATKYVVYGAQRTSEASSFSDITWHKVATLSASKAESLNYLYTIKTINDRAVNTKKYYVYTTVVAYVNYGTKADPLLKASQKNYAVYGHTTVS